MPSFLGLTAPMDAVKVDRSWSGMPVCRISALRLIRREIWNADLRRLEKIYQTSSPAESAAAIAVRDSGVMGHTGLQEKPNLVLVVVESWGLSSDPAVNDAMAKL
jgi:hypothetical protein